jgi:hypothetical protein
LIRVDLTYEKSLIFSLVKSISEVVSAFGMAIFLHTKYTISVPVSQVTVNSFKTHLSLMPESCPLQDVHLIDLFAASEDAGSVSIKNVVF